MTHPEFYDHWYKGGEVHIWRWMAGSVEGPYPPLDAKCEHCDITYEEWARGYPLPEAAQKIIARCRDGN